MVSAAADWTPPTVAIQSPGSSVEDTVTLTAAASDDESGIKTLPSSTRPRGSGLDNGVHGRHGAVLVQLEHELGDDARTTCVLSPRTTPTTRRARTVIRTVVANNLSLVLTDPGDVVKGSVPLTMTLYNSGSAHDLQRVEYTVAGTSVWKTTSGLSSESATLQGAAPGTPPVPNGYYDLRAVIVSPAASRTPPLEAVLVDNAAPNVTMIDPVHRSRHPHLRGNGH